VTVAGPLNLASSGAVHASEMYARNLLNFVSLFVTEQAAAEGRLAIDWNDELLARTVWPERQAAQPAAAGG
jgi:NAD(P) transhydrogenase subunit alpha